MFVFVARPTWARGRRPLSPPYGRRFMESNHERTGIKLGTSVVRRLFPERAAHDVGGVAREVLRGGDAAQGRFGAGAPARLERAPALERGEEARGDLRVFPIERERGLGEEVVAGPVRPVELGLVELREGADERAQPVGVGKG